MMSVLLFLLATLMLAASIDVDTLLASMSVEEKIGQMTQIDISVFMNSTSGEVDYEKMREWMNLYKFGSILNSPFSNGEINGAASWTATQWRELLFNIQTMASEIYESKVPIIYGLDSIHGATFVYGAALFPQALNVGASFNPELAFISGLVTGKDTRAAGVPWVFSPVLGLGIQPLWARFPETFGEDPYLAAQLGAALIQGLQATDSTANAKYTRKQTATTTPTSSAGGKTGSDANEFSYSYTPGIPSMAAACMKHFIGYSDPYDGHDRSPVVLADRLMRQLYLPSFQAAIDAGVLTAMESYNDLGGVPMVSSSEYLTNLLRFEMNFTGMMVTDYAEIENLHSWHYVSSTDKEATLLTMTETTVDMSMVATNNIFSTTMIELYNEGALNMTRIDASARRVLELKNILGMFSEPIPPLEQASLTDTVGCDADYEASLNASRESITLLKNTNNNALPLQRTANIAIGGPTCNSLVSQTGGWSFHWQGAQNDGEFPKGVTIQEGLSMFMDATATLTVLAGPTVTATNLSAVDMTAVLEAVETADPPVDYIVVCIGEGTYAEKPGDINDLSLPYGQVEYVSQLKDTGVPIITVLVEGRPRLLSTIPDDSVAVIDAYQPGPMGGQAVAEVLYGLYSPNGKIPFTYPKQQAEIGYTYHHKVEDQCTNPENTFEYVLCPVEWEFGTGLSYSAFTYDSLVLGTTSVDENGSVDVTVTVTNDGVYEGSEFDDAAGTKSSKHTVMLFLFDEYRRVTPEYKLLKRFEKVALKGSESVALKWTLTAEDMQYVGIDSRYVLESGAFHVGIGPQSDCRVYDYTPGATNLAPDGTPMLCATFDLSLSPSYNAVCDYACDMWSRGVCGHVVGESECQSTCATQGWAWNYVDCIENAVVNNQCDSNFLCYDSFNDSPTPSSNDSGGNSTDVSQTSLIVAILCCTVGGLLVGIGGTYYAMSASFSAKESKYEEYERLQTAGGAGGSSATGNDRTTPLL